MNAGYPYTIYQVTAPAAAIMTTAEAKAHLNVSITDDDTFIDTLVASATRYVEKITARQLIDATFRLTFDEFPPCIQLPYSPVRSGNFTSITYTDIAGASQTLASTNYQVNHEADPVTVKPAYNTTWPVTRPDTYRAVICNYVGGYGAASTSVPADLIHAIKAIVGELYEHREPTITGTIVARIESISDWLLWPYRTVAF